MASTGIAALVQRQLDAYNAKDIDAWLDTYSPNAEQYLLHGECVARGREEIRARILPRFAEPDLCARLVNRVIMGNIAVDHEVVTRNFPEGRGSVEIICIYEIADGLIRKASFAFGEKKAHAPHPPT